MKTKLFAALVITALVPIGLVASCKQGEGERCQVDDDCESPLVCAQATQTCADNNTSAGIDALPPIDAPADAAPPDAPPDTP